MDASNRIERGGATSRSSTSSPAPAALAERSAAVEVPSEASKSAWQEEADEVYARRIALMHPDAAELQREDDKMLAERRARKDALHAGWDSHIAGLRDAGARLEEVKKKLTEQRTNRLELLALLNEYFKEEDERKAKQEARFLTRLLRCVRG